MEYLRFLKGESEALGTRFIGTAMLAGVANAILVGIVIAAGSNANGKSGQGQAFAIFILAFLLYVITRKYVLDRTSVIVEGVVRKVRVRICDKIRRTDLSAFEDIGKANIQQVLAQGTKTMSEAASVVTSAGSSIVLIAFSLLYIATVSIGAFLAITGLTGLMVFVYMRNYSSIRHEVTAAWAVENSFFEAANDQLEGLKELKMNERKSDDLFENDIKRIAEESEALKLSTARKFNWNVIFGQSFFYALIGAIIFVVPSVIEQPDLPVMQIVSVVLFIIGPLSELVAAIPALARANVATEQIRQFEARLAGLEDEYAEPEIAVPPFESLRCERLTFRYPEVGGREPFQVGPVDLEVRRGEVLFLIGGNGTGKSTLLSLLAGLRMPTDGRMLVNDIPVTRSRLPRYRAYFSIILQDFRLFRRLLGLEAIDHGRIDDLLNQLKMTGIVYIDKLGRFESINLSTGQRKRLALLVTELDDREIYLFDEWAADQDPSFRRYFYTELLQEFRRRGKTVIAATHDDHYFHVADRIFKMSDGQLVPWSISETGGADVAPNLPRQG